MICAFSHFWLDRILFIGEFSKIGKQYSWFQSIFISSLVTLNIFATPKFVGTPVHD